jgi:serine/threonine protein kinase
VTYFQPNTKQFEVQAGVNYSLMLFNIAGRHLRLPQLIQMSAEIAQGMAYIEKMNYIHRDLAARNVLVGEHNTVKVSSSALLYAVESIGGSIVQLKPGVCTT